MNKVKYLFVTLMTMLALGGHGHEKFNIRGVLPWHNFLSGPSAWNEDDYRKYLDECQQNGINFIGFHNYTGGGERYATYVEPMVKIGYKGIVPEAYFDNSLSCRWGYLPMKVSDYAFGTDKAFNLPKGADAFGSDVSVMAKSAQEHYDGVQTLMGSVLKMAHERGMKMAMGFEFGVLPPEYFSLHVEGNCFYWSGESTMIPNPKNNIAVQLHYAAIDNILEAYKDIDYIWLWLNEHSFMSVDTDKALTDKGFAGAYAASEHFFGEAPGVKERFVGVWALEYIQLTYDYLKSKGSNAKLILGGWGGGHQLPALLKGLDRALPKDIVFSCLNPDLGKTPQPQFLADIAKNRTVWGIPWLEGDHQLWHFQPRVDMMREHVQLAAQQNLDGVLAIHWRTEETRFNFRTFAHFASNKESKMTTQQLYRTLLSEQMGEQASTELTPLLLKMDTEQTQWNVPSPEFYAFTPHWGLLDGPNVELRQEIVKRTSKLIGKASGEQKAALIRFDAMFRFELLLNDVERAILPAFELQKAELERGAMPSMEQYRKAYASLEAAPIKQMFDTYVARINSRGELGVLSSLNQRLWREYGELKSYLEGKIM